MGNMKKVTFIIPYFGKFNNYFGIFLNSCATNQEYEWIIFTDDRRTFIYPPNVKVEYCTFEDVRNRIQSKFDFNIALKNPYKLCDYKVAYGYIFEDYLYDSLFWGYCDCDLIFGNLSKFISQDDLDKFDKIGILGHCTLYKNIDKCNRAFMLELNGRTIYKEIFQNNDNCSFDEEFNLSINSIFQEYGFTIRKDEYEANLLTKSSNFKITRLNLDTLKYENEKKIKSFFVWENGALYRYILKGKRILREEYMYIHMQSRIMNIRMHDLSVNKFKIIPNSFDDLEVHEISNDTIKQIKTKHFNIHYFKLRFKNLIIKLKKIFK